MEEENKEEQLIAGAPMRFQENAVEATPVFPSPFNSKIGNSTVDLSDKANNDKMLEEYNNWWGLCQVKKFGFLNTLDDSKAEERNKMRDEWYQNITACLMKSIRKA